MSEPVVCAVADKIDMQRINISNGLFFDVPERLAKTYENFEPCTTQVIKEQLKPGSVFLDIGANFGFFSVLAASLVGPNGHVFAVEASPLVLPQLTANLAGFSNVDVIASAVGDRVGMTEFHMTDDFVNSGVAMSPFIAKSHKISVAIDRLDNLLNCHANFTGRVDFVKCDVQGDEYAVLSGLKETIDKNAKLQLIVEWAPTWMANAGFDGQALPEFLKGLGFHDIIVIDDYLKKTMSVSEMEEEFRKDTTGKRFCNVLASK